jgi:hypothetical protein
MSFTTVFLAEYNRIIQVEEDEMGRAYPTHEGGFGGKT